MKYSVELTDNFKKEAKRLLKKYHSLKGELLELTKQLAKNQKLGEDLGNNVYKIRLAVKSKGKGKNGGVRIISFVKVSKTAVLLFSIYNKSEKDSISDKEIQRLTKDL